MHVSQIWNIWKYRKARCLMHSSAQYRWYKIQEINKKRIKTKILSVNEKIYIFIWFWLLFLGFLSSVVIVYRIVIVFSPYIRAFVLRLRYRQAFVVFSCFFINKYWFRRVKKECIDTIIGKSYVGDWFLFYLLGQNIDSVIFKVRYLQ